MIRLLLLSAVAWACSSAQSQTLRQVDTCSWAKPGANPTQITPVDAVQHYADHFTPAQLAELRRRVAKIEFDEIVEIRADQIVSTVSNYEPEIGDMLFGKRTKCAKVQRPWAPGQVERALIYCPEGSDKCLAFPTVCRNASIITKARMAGPGLRAPPAVSAPQPGGPPPPLWPGPSPRLGGPEDEPEQPARPAPSWGGWERWRDWPSLPGNTWWTVPKAKPEPKPAPLPEQIRPVPEPSSLTLLAAAFLIGAAFRRKE